MESVGQSHHQQSLTRWTKHPQITTTCQKDDRPSNFSLHCAETTEEPSSNQRNQDNHITGPEEVGNAFLEEDSLPMRELERTIHCKTQI